MIIIKYINNILCIDKEDILNLFDITDKTYTIDLRLVDNFKSHPKYKVNLPYDVEYETEHDFKIKFKYKDSLSSNNIKLNNLSFMDIEFGYVYLYVFREKIKGSELIFKGVIHLKELIERNGIKEVSLFDEKVKNIEVIPFKVNTFNSLKI
ncbi:hypothetical protein A0H76_683 [Hepatospora eriocheir]|uniref:Uncharacterized protein n=1 Tax=Hepatospora eriocheir TaxID=1081669 RepID=A0A1X0QIP4_9MICR|nr:hypothetical protein A0H76_683 [Hepatospora eriocheir]